MQVLAAILALAFAHPVQVAPSGPQEPEIDRAAVEDPGEPAPEPRERGPGPWNDDLVLLRSGQGASWEAHGVLVPHAGVASACRMGDGRVLVAFQWFPRDRPEAFDRIAVLFSGDGGESWSEPEPITIEGLPEEHQRPCDPCVVPLDGGRLRMYFTSRVRTPGDGAGGVGSGDLAATWSATSSDGLTWTFEPGQRFGLVDQPALDPAVVRFRGEWHYFAPIQGREGAAFHAVSADGLTFQRWPEVELPGSGHWLGCVLSESEHGEPDAFLRFYGTGRRGWSATSRDARRWRLDGRIAWQGADPAVVRLEGGELLMVATVHEVTESDEAGKALLAALAGGPTVAMTANDRYLYVLRGETIFMFDASTLRFLRRMQLPLPRPPEEEPPPVEDPAPEHGGAGDGR